MTSRIQPRTYTIDDFAKRSALILYLSIMVLILAGVPILVFVWGLEEALLAAISLVLVLVLLLPIVSTRNYDIFQPLSFVFLSAFVGVTLRTLYVLLFPDNMTTWDLLQGHGASFLAPALLAVVLGMSFYVVGYVQGTVRLPLGRFKIAKYDDWNEKRLFIIVILFASISVIATGALLRSTGFSIQDLSDLSSLSRKRYLVVEGTVTGYAAQGYLRWASSLGAQAFLLYMAWFSYFRKRWFSTHGLILGVLFVVAGFSPFATSNRGVLMWVLLSSMIIWHYLRKKLSRRTILLSLMLALFIVSFMLNLRGGHQQPAVGSRIGGIIEDLVASRDLLDITTTAIIIDALHSGKLNYQYGSTYLTWLYAPIPRTVWRDKPIISVGAIVRESAFGYGGRGGIPPGILGEAYWNFGVVGLIFVLWFMGFLTRVMYESMQLPDGAHPNLVILYAVVIAPWSLASIGGGWSGAFITALQSAIPLMIVLSFITRKPRNIGK